MFRIQISGTDRPKETHREYYNDVIDHTKLRIFLALRPVAVVGGGLGGLTTAAALIKKGIPVQVFERDERNARPQGKLYCSWQEQ